MIVRILAIADFRAINKQIKYTIVKFEIKVTAVAIVFASLISCSPVEHVDVLVVGGGGSGVSA